MSTIKYYLNRAFSYREGLRQVHCTYNPDYMKRFDSADCEECGDNFNYCDCEDC